jgi:4-hydroxybenzoate polyprenyltransferase
MSPYIQIARIDHWFKNVFIVPGIMLAVLADPAVFNASLIWSIPLATLAVCLAASSNYVINEILDAPRDMLHPEKQHRPVPAGKINRSIALTLWIALAVVALLLGYSLHAYLGLSLALLLLQGIFYNLPPFRTKELPYLDVISEAVNNPIRLAVGWYATGCALIPPVSLLMAYWAFGAFLMVVKRFAEFRYLDNAQLAADYRSSFKHYNEARLLISMMFYTTACAMFGGIFIARYHLELVLTVPLFAVFMALYMRVGLKPNSPAQHPERLLRSRSIVLATFFLTVVVCFSLWLDSPGLRKWFTPSIPPQTLAQPATP